MQCLGLHRRSWIPKSLKKWEFRAMCSGGNSRSQFKTKVQGFLGGTIDEVDVAAYGLVFFLLAGMKTKVP